MMTACSEQEIINQHVSETANNVKEELCGTWQYGSRSVGAGYNHLYTFDKDGSYEFEYSQYDGENREKGHSGEWDVRGNMLILTVKKKTVLEGGALQESSGSVLSEKEIVGGKLKEVLVEPVEKLEYVISGYDEINGSVKIGNQEFWNMDISYREKEAKLEDKEIAKS